jgi:hypothetical protein
MAEETKELSVEAANVAAAQAALDDYKAECDKYVTQADKQLDQLIERHKLSNQEFDKQLVAIAGGGLALTITLTKDLLTKEDSGLVWLLYTSWMLFVVCLAVNLFSHRAASTHYNLMIERLSAIRQATSKYEEAQAEYTSELTRKIDALTPRIESINTLAWVSCMAGVVMFIIFITTNRYLHNDQPGPTAATTADAAAPARPGEGPASDRTPPQSAPAANPPAASGNARADAPSGDTSRRVGNSPQHPQPDSSGKART